MSRRPVPLPGLSALSRLPFWSADRLRAYADLRRALIAAGLDPRQAAASAWARFDPPTAAQEDAA